MVIIFDSRVMWVLPIEQLKVKATKSTLHFVGSFSPVLECRLHYASVTFPSAYS